MRTRLRKLGIWSLCRFTLAAVACVCSLSAFALQPLGDEALSETTGQQGIDISSNYSIGVGLVTSAGAACTNNCTGGVNIIDADGFTLSAQAFTSTNATGGSAFNVRGFTLAGNSKLSLDVGGDGGTTAASKAVFNAKLALLNNNGMSMTFSSQLPTGTYSLGLGVQVADVCAVATISSTAAGCTTANVANDYPVIMAPATGVKLNLQSAGIVAFNLQLASGTTGHMGMLTSTDATTTFTISKAGTCAGEGSAAVSCTTTGVNFALVDPGNFNTVNTDVGGVGFGSLAINGLDFGNSVANNISLDVCNGTATANCAANRTNGAAGILSVINGTALGDFDIVAKGIVIGNVGSGASSANNGLGAVAIQNMNMSGISVLLSAH